MDVQGLRSSSPAAGGLDRHRAGLGVAGAVGAGGMCPAGEERRACPPSTAPARPVSANAARGGQLGPEPAAPRPPPWRSPPPEWLWRPPAGLDGCPRRRGGRGSVLSSVSSMYTPWNATEVLRGRPDRRVCWGVRAGRDWSTCISHARRAWPCARSPGIRSYRCRLSERGGAWPGPAGELGRDQPADRGLAPEPRRPSLRPQSTMHRCTAVPEVGLCVPVGCLDTQRVSTLWRALQALDPSALASPVLSALSHTCRLPQSTHVPPRRAPMLAVRLMLLLARPAAARGPRGWPGRGLSRFPRQPGRVARSPETTGRRGFSMTLASRWTR